MVPRRAPTPAAVGSTPTIRARDLRLRWQSTGSKTRRSQFDAAWSTIPRALGRKAVCKTAATGWRGSIPRLGTSLGPWPNGRAPAWQAGECRFESDRLHHGDVAQLAEHPARNRKVRRFDPDRLHHAVGARRDRHRPFNGSLLSLG
jgi:hypothetical protein